MARPAQLAAPIVSVIDPDTLEVEQLGYGPQPALAQRTFYTETQQAFVADEVTFLDLDLASDRLRYYESGQLVLETAILDAGVSGSWWEVVSGLYQVVETDRRFVSRLAGATFPWTVRFEENFLLHGLPLQRDGTPVNADFAAGGVQIADTAAEVLVDLVAAGTPVLVHRSAIAPEPFVYEPPAPDISAPHYFVADLDTGAVLASDGVAAPVPIASITKLMTAVVAAEQLQLDAQVFIAASSSVPSLVPRLTKKSTVSMYSLLQLLLVESSNEAAEVIANELGRADFIAAMNEKAAQLGMVNTTFADPSGLSANNVSSAGDLFRLTKHIHDNRRFILDLTKDAAMTGANASNAYDNLTNFNEVEGVVGFVGGKVGETSAAGQTTVSLYDVPISDTTRTIVFVLLGSTGRSDDITALVSFVGEQFNR